MAEAVTIPVIQVGVTAMRDADGNFLPAVKLYVEATEETEKAQETMFQDFARLIAPAFGEYMKMLPGLEDET